VPRLLPARFRVECISEFALAADARYAEAVRLADHGHRTGAIYLFGYVVEMHLKIAFLRLVGHADDVHIPIATLWNYVGQRTTTVARSLGLPGATNLHDLTAWAQLIVAYRAHHGPAYANADFAGALVANVTEVGARWSETLRYHGNVAYAHELDRVRTSCVWVSSNSETI
jgi:hypothetical protein